MQRAIWIFIVGTVVLVAVFAAGGAYLMQQKSLFGGLVLGLTMLVPLTMAFVAHRASGASGNPFKGLTWGPTSWYFLAWLGGLAAGFLACALSLGLGFAALDLEMNDFVESAIAQAEEQSGRELPSDAVGGIKITGYIMAFGGPTIGPWFVAALICLGTFPWLGFLFRRLLVRGKMYALAMLALLWFLVNAAGGMAENAMVAEVPLATRMLLGGLMGAATAPAVAWLFLRTGSAVIPALALASFQGMMSAATVLFGDTDMLLSAPMGLLAVLAALLAGIALWVWKDPGGEQLAVAGIASDGTPLTPQQLAALQSMPPAVEPQPQQEPVAL